VQIVTDLSKNVVIEEEASMSSSSGAEKHRVVVVVVVVLACRGLLQKTLQRLPAVCMLSFFSTTAI
jgi:hypothetical protein